MRRFGTHINGGMMALGHYMIIDGALEIIWVSKFINMMVCKPMIVGSFDLMEYLVMIPSSLNNGVIFDGLKVHGNYLV